MNTDRIAGILLAGGQSRRMGGGDKCLCLLAGRPMLGHAAARLGPQVGALAISANGDPRRFGDFALPVIADSIAGLAGPLAGILAGMEWAAREAGRTHLVSAASDTPFFPADLVSRLAVASAGAPARIAVAASDGRSHPVFGLWPISLREDLRHFLEDGSTYKVTAFVEKHDFVLADFPMLALNKGMADPFFNVNTQADLIEAERIHAELVA